MMSQDMVSKANECFENGLYEQSISEYIQVMQTDKQRYKYFCERGQQFALLGKEQLAIERLSYYYLENYQKSITDFTQVLQRCPQFKFCFNDRGNAYFSLQQLELAIQDYTEAIKLDDSYIIAYNNRGLSLYSLGRKQDAITDYSKAIEMNPQYAQAYFNRGVLLNDIDRKQDAINDYNKAITIDPQYAEAYNNKGILLSNLERNEDAINDYTRALEINPQYAQAYFNRGVLLNDMERKQEALKDYNKAIEINPQYAEAYYNRGILLSNLERNEDAINDYTKVIHINPQYAQAYLNRGVLLNDLGSKEDALNDYTKAIEIDQKYAEAYNNRGVSFNDLGRKENALNDYNKAIQINPEYAEAYFNRGVLFNDMEKQQEAFNDYYKAFQITPQDPLYNVQLGRFHLRNDEKEQAHEYYSNALKIMETITKQNEKKYNLTENHINYIKDYVKLVQQIENGFKKAKSIITSQILSQEEQAQHQEKIRLIDEDYRNQFRSSIHKNQIKDKNDYLAQILKNVEQQNQIIIKENEILKKENEILRNEQQQQKQQIQQILNQKRFRIEKEMNEIKQDNNRYIYYQSLFWRLSNYISACQLLTTELFQKNPNATIDNNGEKIANISKQVGKQISKIAESIPIVGSVITIITPTLEFVFDGYLNNKLNQIVQKLTQIVQLRCTNRNEIDEEIQLAVIEYSKQLPNIQNYQQQEEQGLLNYTKEIWKTVEQQTLIINIRKICQIDIDSGYEQANDPYWKLGIVDTLKALHNLVLNYQNIQKDQNRDLNLIILDSLEEKTVNLPAGVKPAKIKKKNSCQIQ